MNDLQSRQCDVCNNKSQNVRAQRLSVYIPQFRYQHINNERGHQKWHGYQHTHGKHCVYFFRRGCGIPRLIEAQHNTVFVVYVIHTEIRVVPHVTDRWLIQRSIAKQFESVVLVFGLQGILVSAVARIPSELPKVLDVCALLYLTRRRTVDWKEICATAYGFYTATIQAAAEGQTVPGPTRTTKRPASHPPNGVSGIIDTVNGDGAIFARAKVVGEIDKSLARAFGLIGQQKGLRSFSNRNKKNRRTASLVHESISRHVSRVTERSSPGAQILSLALPFFSSS